MTYYSDYDLETEVQQEFSKGLRRAFRRRLMRRGKFLQSFDESYGNRFEQGLLTISVDQIIGSVSDNHNFDDQFNPRNESSQQRWVRLYIGFVQGDAIPPIEVYKVNDDYYVLDGHHRVSVARSIGQKTIEANVVRIESPRCA